MNTSRPFNEKFQNGPFFSMVFHHLDILEEPKLDKRPWLLVKCSRGPN